MSDKKGFVIYLTPDTVIWQERLPRGLVHDPKERTLRSETGSIGRSIGDLSGEVEGVPFSIGTRLVVRITDLKGNIQLENK
jgi:hypothetical protein